MKPEMLIFFGLIWAIFPIASIVAGVKIQRMRSEERLRAIEKGVVLPSGWSNCGTGRPEERAVAFRVGGIINICIGLGLLVLFGSLAATLPKFPRGVIGCSAIPFFIGIGLLIEYKLRSRTTTGAQAK